MANLPISGLTASTTSLAAVDVLPVVQTTGVGPVKMTGQQLAGGLLGSTTLSGATLTADAPVLNLTQTWNNAAVTFTGAKLNITGADAGSAAGSLLMDLQKAGVSQFSVNKNGLVGIANSSWLQGGFAGGNIIAAVSSAGAETGSFLASIYYFRAAGSSVAWWDSTNQALSLGTAASVCWGNNSAAPSGTIDLRLRRRAAANLQLGAADAAGSAIAVNSVASNQLTLASAHGLTNGAAVQVTFTGGGAVPVGTAVNTTYYARSISAAVIELYGTFDQATAASGTTGIIAVTTAGTTAFINRAAPFQTLSVQSFTGTDIPGQPFVITGSQGTGTGAGGPIIFQVAPRGTTGSTANAFATQFQVNGSGGVTGQDGATANTLALRNGTAAQTFRVYNTESSSLANFERLSLIWSSNLAIIRTESAGTGVARELIFGVGGGAQWGLNTSGHLITYGSDNTYDIGASGANRPRSIYAGTSITPGAGVAVASLPTPTTGMVARVTNALAPAVGTTVAGGGAAQALVWYNGANWTVIGV